MTEPSDAPHTSTTETAKPSNQELAAEQAEHRDTAFWLAEANAETEKLAARVEALLAERDALARDRDDLRFMHTVAERAVDESQGRVFVLEAALQRIKDNAEAWHGPVLDGGHSRALAVIAKWAGAVLAGGDAAPRPEGADL